MLVNCYNYIALVQTMNDYGAWTDTDRKKLKYLEKMFFSSQPVHCISHTDCEQTSAPMMIPLLPKMMPTQDSKFIRQLSALLTCYNKMHQERMQNVNHAFSHGFFKDECAMRINHLYFQIHMHAFITVLTAVSSR
jgi:hypothetical protein